QLSVHPDREKPFAWRRPTKEGRMISFIQSNFSGFGSGVVVPDTGISLQNRSSGFTLEENYPNQVGGGKRPFHTIIPAFVTRDGMPLISYGVMGGHMQPQGHAQMMVRLFDYGQNPQTALDAPRWRFDTGLQVALEASVGVEVCAELERRGHKLHEQGPAPVRGWSIDPPSRRWRLHRRVGATQGRAGRRFLKSQRLVSRAEKTEFKPALLVVGPLPISLRGML
ncbi:MAG: gamma-glutamyltransferase, partial [Candidatus Latescibacterota bacterium]